MPKLKKDVRPLLERGLDSLILSIELFNRPSETARSHSVLILLHHSFEMLLKAAILQRTGRIHDAKERYTYGFDKCLAVAADIGLLAGDEISTLSILDAQRDNAVHFYAEVSEEVLYIHVQSGVTLFKALLKKAFGDDLVQHIPNRVLPVSAHPPGELHLLLERELTEVDGLLSDGSRKGARAAARLRSLLAFATASRDNAQRVSARELNAAISRRRRGDEWSIILPEIAQLKLATEGAGVEVSVRIHKSGEIPVRMALPGEIPQGVVIKHEINPFDKYTLNLDALAEKLKLTRSRTLALVYETRIQEDDGCFRLFTLGSVRMKRYSKVALDRLRTVLDGGADVGAIWAKHRHRIAVGKKRSK